MADPDLAASARIQPRPTLRHGTLARPAAGQNAVVLAVLAVLAAVPPVTLGGHPVPAETVAGRTLTGTGAAAGTVAAQPHTTPASVSMLSKAAAARRPIENVTIQASGHIRCPGRVTPQPACRGTIKTSATVARLRRGARDTDEAG